MQKHATLLTPLFLQNRIFGLRYQHQFLKIMSLWMVQMPFPYQFNWVNETRNTSLKNPITKTKCFFHGVNFLMSDLQYIVVLRETYKVQTRKYYCWHGTNEYIPYVPYIFLSRLMYKIQIQLSQSDFNLFNVNFKTFDKVTYRNSEGFQKILSETSLTQNCLIGYIYCGLDFNLSLSTHTLSRCQCQIQSHRAIIFGTWFWKVLNVIEYDRS